MLKSSQIENPMSNPNNPLGQMNQANPSNNIDTGQLQVSAVQTGTKIPIANVTVSISFTGEPERTIEELKTDSSGQTEIVTLETPPLEYSMEFGQPQPYAEYNLTIRAEGYEPTTLAGIEVMSGVKALSDVELTPIVTEQPEQVAIVIGPHTLYGEYPPKIAESETKPVTGSGEIVLSRVVVPEYVIVHNGPPSDDSSLNYYERYKDYIKNVASCEIYATWPRATLEANILAIMSFTLNRVYTEWYRNIHSFRV